MKNIEYVHNKILMKFVYGDDRSLKMWRFEPMGYSSYVKRHAAFEPFIVKTAESTASPMEGCGSIPSVWDGGVCEIAEESERGVTLKFLKADGALEVTVRLEFIEGCDVIRQTNTVKNISDRDVTLTHFSSGMICGIGMGGALDRWDEEKIRVHYCMNHWCGEAQWREASLEEVGIYRQSMHNWDMSSFRTSSVGTWSTSRYYPLMIIEDRECGKVWYMEHEGAANWTEELACLNNCGEGFLMLEANSADEESGFVHTLAAGESYTATPCVYGTTDGGFEEAVRELIKYKRSTSLVKWERGYAPACFNDYMNCLWALPDRERLIPLIDAAADAGCELFCMDDGWQLESLGTWSVNDEKYGEGGLEGIVRYIQSKGMTAGIWLELEACERDRVLYKDDCLVHRNGSIVNPSRAHINFESEEARAYLLGVIDRFYKMGIRFIKNDHNRSVMLGCDDGGECCAVGLKKTGEAFLSFIDGVRERYPDLVIENCASGAMRSDNGTLRHFEIQSVSDQEYYYMTSSITSGTLAFLPAEKAGVWAYPYPVSYGDRENNELIFGEEFRSRRADGEETVYNMVTALMGSLYLSGRIDRADELNRSLIREGVERFKEIRTHNAKAYPVYPCGRYNIGNRGMSCIGLMSDKGDKMTLAVWRRECKEDTLTVDMSRYLNRSSDVKMTYPQDRMGAEYSYDGDTRVLTVKLPMVNSARFFEIEVN